MSTTTTALPPGKPRSTSERDFSAAFKWSSIGHGVLILLILIKSVVFPGQSRLYTPTLRVDMVGLPDILKKDMKQFPNLADLPKSEQVSKTEPRTEEQATPDELVLKPKKSTEKEAKKARDKKLRSALDRIKALDRITSEDAKPVPQIKGNIVSKGTSLSANAKEAAEATYFDVLRDRLQESWALPVYLSRQSLSAQVRIYIDSTGHVKRMQFQKISGNPKFDEEVKRTINESQPLPKPPEGLAGSVLQEGVVVGFPL